MSSLPPDDDRTVMAPRSGASRPDSDISDPRDRGNALPAGTYLDEFELKSVIGEGGFGIVYLAWDHSLERRVALKEYMPAALAARMGGTNVHVKSERHRETFELGLKSFVNEARLLAQFDHRSLVKVYRFWEANGTAYMVMPYYEGPTLKERLAQLPGPPDEAWLLGQLDPLTEALAVLHAERCYHRDIAPDNIILLASTGQPLLLDFGAARRVIGDMTQALTVILKPGYAPVEQYAEAPHMKQGAWTDIYGLAASVHYAITGRTVPPAVSRLMGDSYQPLAQAAAGRYSVRFLEALDKALCVRPEERTQTIDEFREDLGLGRVQVEPQRTQLWEAPAASSLHLPGDEDRRSADKVVRSVTAAQGRSRRPLWLGAGAFVLGGGLLGAYLIAGRPDPTPEPRRLPPVVAQSPPTEIAPAPATVPAPLPDSSPQLPAAPARFDVREEFDKVLAGRDPGFKVEARAAKEQLRIGGDRLSFTVRSARDGFVHVLVLGPDGSLLLLYPNARARENRIRAGQTLTLPEASWALDTAEPAGMEHFLVIVSEQPRDYMGLSQEQEYFFTKLPTGERALQASSGWSSGTPILLGQRTACEGDRCDNYGAEQFAVEVVR